jgi:hypothetical protein
MIFCNRVAHVLLTRKNPFSNAAKSEMAEPEQKTQDALNESRILVLGVQVLLSFQYSSALETALDQLPYLSQCLELVALALLMIAFGLFVAPAPNHLLVWSDDEGPNLQRFVTKAVEIGLMPFAAALAIDIYIAAARTGGLTIGVVLGAATFGCAMFFWYGLEAVHRQTRGHRVRSQARSRSVAKEKHQSPDIEEKIQHALTDARVVLPGAQALLDFQLVGVLLGGFEHLPASSQNIHVTSLSLVTLSTILLMTPAAYHRLIEQGEPSEHFYRLAKTAVLCSMVPLGAGICGDFFIVIRKISGSLILANSITVLLMAIFFILWFGFGLVKRGHGEAVLRFE